MPLLAAVLLSLFLRTSDDLTLTVNVLDPGGKAVPQVTLILEKTTDQKRWDGATSDAGTYRFERLSAGSYVLRVVKEGYYADDSDLRLEASKVVDFTIVPVEGRHDEVEVIARPEAINTDAVSVQHTVSNEVLQNVPFTGRRNFLNALTVMPGVVKDSNGALHIHGSRSDQIRYQLDGMNLNDPSGGLSSNIPIDAIESVDLDVAGYSAESGKGSGGVVRVESKFVGDKLKWNVTDFFPGMNFKRMTIGDWDPRFLLSGPIVRRKAWFMYSGSLRYVRTFNEGLPEGANRQNTTQADQLLKLQWNLAESHVVTMSLLTNTEYYGNLGLSPSRPIETTTNFLRRGTTAAVANRNILRGTFFETTVQWTHRRESELGKGTETLVAAPGGWTGNFYADRRGRTDRFHVSQVAAREERFRGIVHRFKTGAEWDYVISDLGIDRRPFEVRDAANQLQVAVRFVGPSFASIRNRETGFFAQDRMTLSRRLQVELGMRADHETVAGALNIAPRVAGSFLPFADDRSKVSAGVGLFYDNVALNQFQLPQMQRRVLAFYDANGFAQESSTPAAVGLGRRIESPYGINWNAAWDQQWAPRWVSRINVIQKRGKHQTRLAAVPDPNGYGLEFNSSGKSTYDAVEMSIDRPIRTNLRILGSYIYSQTKARPSLTFEFPDPSLEDIPLAPVGWNTRHRFVTWGYFPFVLQTAASFAVEVRSGFPFSTVDEFGHLVGPYNGNSMPTFFATNFAIEKEIPIVFGKRMAIRLSSTNLFNRFNPRYVDGNVHSPTFLQYSDSTGRAFSGRVRIIKK